MLHTLPQLALQHILQLAEQPLVLKLYKADHSSLTELEDLEDLEVSMYNTNV